MGSVVQVHPGPPTREGKQGLSKDERDERDKLDEELGDERERKDGAIAQLGEHLLCKQGVVGSIPTGSREKEESRKDRSEKAG